MSERIMDTPYSVWLILMDLILLFLPIERVVWIDFDVAATFQDTESVGSEVEEYFKWSLLKASAVEPYPGLQQNLTVFQRGSKTRASPKYQILLVLANWSKPDSPSYMKYFTKYITVNKVFRIPPA